MTRNARRIVFTRHTTAGRLLWVLASIFPAIVQADAQIALNATQTALGRLGPDQAASSLALVVDQADTLTLALVSTAENLVTGILGPGGEVIDPNTVAQFGGQFAFIPESAVPSGVLITPLGEPGHRYLYELPSLGPGVYSVRFALLPPPTEDIPVIADLMLDSPIKSTLLVTESVLPVGGTAILCVALFNGDAPLAGAPVSVMIKSPLSPRVQELTLSDGGGGYDGAAGDGLYCGAIGVGEPGEHLLAARATQPPGALPFVRTSAASLTVIEPGAQIATLPATQLVDDNGNGRPDRLVVNVGVAVSLPGTYFLAVLLRTPSGTALQARGSPELLPSSGFMSAALSAQELRDTQEDGPYVIEALYLHRFSSDGAFLADRNANVNVPTVSFSLAQLERPALELTGANNVTTVDTNADGDFDLLRVELGISVTEPGPYAYTVSVVDACQSEVQFLVGQQNFPSGQTPERLLLNIDGARIGQHGIDGPYRLRNFAITGPGGALWALEVAETTFLAANQFDAFTPPSDCNANAVPDACDLAGGTSIDCNADQVPDECGTGPELDCNGNAVPDACDVAVGTSLDCNGNAVPDECESDCNGNGVADACDVAAGTSLDCNTNIVPDECESDCNNNGVADACDVSPITTRLIDTAPPVHGFYDISKFAGPLNLPDNGYGFGHFDSSNPVFGDTQMKISNNGAVGFGGFPKSELFLPTNNTTLPISGIGTHKVLFAYWDDLGSDTGSVYRGAFGSGADRTHVIQWNNRPHVPGDAVLNGNEVTFQVQIFETLVNGLAAQFLYADTDFQDPLLNDGASASVGYQDGAQGWQWSYNTAGAVHPGVVVSLQVGPTSYDTNANGIPDECEVPACTTQAQCQDAELCTVDVCDPSDGVCVNVAIAYGDVNDDGFTNVDDSLCLLDTFAGTPDSVSCLGVFFEQKDIAPCPSPSAPLRFGDGFVNVNDVLTALDIFAGIRPPGCPCL